MLWPFTHVKKKILNGHFFSHFVYGTKALLLCRMMTSSKYFERTLHCITVQRLEHIQCPVFPLSHGVFSVPGIFHSWEHQRLYVWKSQQRSFPITNSPWQKVHKYRIGRKYFPQKGLEEWLFTQYGKRILYDPISQKTTQMSNHYVLIIIWWKKKGNFQYIVSFININIQN